MHSFRFIPPRVKNTERVYRSYLRARLKVHFVCPSIQYLPKIVLLQ
jgi:hypothetical protein